MSELKICEFNVENLFISLDYYEGEDLTHLPEAQWRNFALKQMKRKQKPLKKLWGLVSAIDDIDPDILMLIEVGGESSLHHFNTHFLSNRYACYFIPSNSTRGIDLAYLVKKDLPFTVKAISNRDTEVVIQAYQGPIAARFSRDAAELQIFRGKELILITLLLHLKSKISSDRDFQGNDMRRAEAETLARLYQAKRLQHPQVPVVVGGDFNSQLSSPELESLAKTDLTDFHDVLSTPPDERVSFVHFDRKGIPQPQTLDYLLISPDLKNKVVREKSFTYRYRSFYDIPQPLPNTMGERYFMPSDHFPVVLTLKMETPSTDPKA